MRKLVFVISLIAGLLFGMKQSFYFTAYDGLLVVAFIVISPLILSALIADFINHWKKKTIQLALSNLMVNTVLSSFIVLAAFLSVNFGSEFLYNRTMMSAARGLIEQIDQYQKDHSKIPEALYRLKAANYHEFVYQRNTDNLAYKLSYVSSKGLFDATKVHYAVFDSQTQKWIRTTQSSQLGF